jgi:hypothetical protein
MLALSIALIVVSASPMKPHRERGAERAARLMSTEERAQFAELNIQLMELRRPSDNVTLFTGSIITMASAAVVPVGLAAVGIVGSFFVGLVGLLAPSLWSAIPAMWVGLFSWVPLWGWIAMGVAAVAGVAMLITAQAGDAPRRERVQAVNLERRRLIEIAAARPDVQLMAPPLVSF